MLRGLMFKTLSLGLAVVLSTQILPGVRPLALEESAIHLAPHSSVSVIQSQGLRFFLKQVLWAPLNQINHFISSLGSVKKEKVSSRRDFLKGTVAGMVAMAAVGCVTTTETRDKVTEAQILPKVDSKLPAVLHFDLNRFIEDAIKNNPELRRIFAEHYLATIVKERIEEGASDVKILAELSAVFNASTIPQISAGMFATGDVYSQSFNAAYQTHAREHQDATTAPANLLAAPIFNDASGALNSINPELYIPIPLVGGKTVSNPEDAAKEAIVAKARYELNRIVYEVTQAYFQIVELKQDLVWLQQQEALLQAAGLEEKLSEVKKAIADTDYPLRQAYLVLLEKASYRRDHFDVRLDQVVVEPQDAISLRFDENNPSHVPVFDEKQSLDRMTKNSSDYVRLTGQINVTEEAIGAAKYNATRPSVTLVFGFEPPNAGLVGLLAELRPFRFRTAEGQIMELRTKYVDYSAAKEQVLQGYEYKIANFFLDRGNLIERVKVQREDFLKNDKAVDVNRAYLMNSAGGATAPSEVKTRVEAALRQNKLSSVDISNLVELLETKRRFQSELRKFQNLEASRFVLEGLLVDDSRTGQVLNGLKDYFNPFIEQEPIIFHNWFQPLKSILIWIGLSFSTLFSGELFAQEKKVAQIPPAIRWQAPELAPIYREPAFAASL